MLLRAVRVQEFTRNINDLFAVPFHDKTGGFSHDGDFRCLKILGIRKGKEPVRILFRDNDSHSLLRFAYRKLGPVKSLILFRHGVEVDMQPVGKLSDRDRNTAGSEIVAPLDKKRRLRVAEQPLELSFDRSISLLDFSPAAFKRFQVMGL
ncbi:unknown [Candidatus Colimorpha enterica]|uniref:Uncharacterized protein n=1 Tax=Candidatus Colimorpha enterica TaxID=3083063 RepID=R6TQ74_9BACT|nr:unknown [Candidatus Colimorpha enterica]